MRSSGWTGLVTGLVAVGLVAGLDRAAGAPASQAASSQGGQAAARFELAPWGYPAGISDSEQYEQYLGKELQEKSHGMAQSAGPEYDLDTRLDAATFALTRAAEPDLTRVWLWRQPQASPELTARALTLAQSALSEAKSIVTRWKPGPTADVWSRRVRVLTALLAMEKALLLEGNAADALQAVDLADVAAEKDSAAEARFAADNVPPGDEPIWDLLLAGCLDKGGRHEDARLRLQILLQRYVHAPPFDSKADGQARMQTFIWRIKNSPSAAAACMLQARMLADAGNHAAAVALVSECLEALPAKDEQLTAPGARRPAKELAETRIPLCSLSLLKARLLEDWAQKMSHSENKLDRQAATLVRELAATWEKKAEELGPFVLRLAPMLQQAPMLQGLRQAPAAE